MPNMSHADYIALLARRAAKGTPMATDCGYGGCADESALHSQIHAECRQRSWIALYSRMDFETGRPVGEWDFTILADGGRVFFIECKTRTGKLRPGQAEMQAWANRLGHTVHIIRSIEDFMQLVT